MLSRALATNLSGYNNNDLILIADQKRLDTIEEKIREGERDLGRLNYFTNEFDFDEFWTEWT